MPRTISKAAQYQLVCLVYVGLACRVLIPVGYMPAPLSAGGPVVLCPGGIPTAFLHGMADRRREHRHGGPGGTADGEDTHRGELNGWESCVFGAVPGVFLPVAEYGVQPKAFGHAPPHSVPKRMLAILLSPSYQARAPPLARIL